MFKVSQWEHENPGYYQQFGLPAHCAIDFPAVNGTPVKAVKSGVVTNIHTNPNTSNYGIYIRLLHENGHRTLYAHLQSVSVVVNQQVASGQTIGLSNNTGNSSGPHLHLELRKDNDPYTDSNGAVWPFGLRPVWQSLAGLYESWLNNNSVVGYLYSPGLIKNMSGDYARVYGTLNIRATPTSNGQVLGQATSHTVVKILSGPVNNYIQVRTPVDIGVTPPPGISRFGLHFRADPDDNVSAAEYQEQRILLQRNGRTAKLLHNHPAAVYSNVCGMTPKPQTIVVRVFQSFHGETINPQTFVQNNVGELINRIQLIRSHNIEPIVEVHNEPNLNDEGLGSSWNNGQQFGTWLRTVLELYRQRQELATIKFIYPGLSPGGTIPGVRRDSTQFLQESINAGVMPFVHGVGCHAYWSSVYPMSGAINHVNHTRVTTNKLLWLTEVSINDRPSIFTPQQYGQQYSTFIKTVGATEGIYFFVGSASNPYFEPETWVGTNGQSKGIATALVNAL